MWQDRQQSAPQELRGCSTGSLQEKKLAAYSQSGVGVVALVVLGMDDGCISSHVKTHAEKCDARRE